jgi:hypothetical protein
LQVLIGFYKGGKGKSFTYGKVILEAFEGRCPEGKELCHVDDDQGNNRLSNLYWGTHIENCRDRSKNKVIKLSPQDVADIRRRRASGEGRNDLAAEYGVAQDYIWMICNDPTLWKSLEPA